MQSPSIDSEKLVNGSKAGPRASHQVLEPTDPPVDYESVARMKPIAERFISDLGVDRSCVFLRLCRRTASEC